MFIPHHHCKFCGCPHIEFESPQKCTQCLRETWHSPSPVSVLIQPITDGSRVGVLIGQRSIRPKLGEWNLVAGYVDPVDPSAEHASTRELNEETGLILESDLVFPTHTFNDGSVLLIFFTSKIIMPIDRLDGFVPNHECSAIRVAWEPEELCFPSHTRALQRWFDKNA